MIHKSMMLSVAKCQECGKIMVYQNVNGIPTVCTGCGVPHNVELTPDQRKRMDEMRHQQGPTIIRTFG